MPATVQDLFGESDPILLDFDIVPFDYEVKDLMSCRMYISANRLAITVDDMIEVYDLKTLSFQFVGKEPKFSLWEQLLEYNMNLEANQFPLSKFGNVPDDFFRFIMYEPNGIAKQYTLRKGNASAKAFQSWALVETIKKLQSDDEDMDLHNMIYGNFSTFDSYFLVIGFVIFVIYALISVLLGGILPDLVKTLLDSFFILVCIVFLGWVIWSMHLNTKRYEEVYKRYRNSINESSTEMS